MKVTVIAHTRIIPDQMENITDGAWRPDDDGPYDDGGSLAEFAGRACYQSWHRPNPATATNEGYLRNILSLEHFSVLEHGSVSLHVAEVSRSLTHELVRHRHFSYSQLSQRFVMPGEEQLVVPPLYRPEWRDAPDPGGIHWTDTQRLVQGVWDHAISAYERLVAIHMPRLIQAGVDDHRARKMAREAARCVLPNMTPTAIVVTGNHRSWREFLAKRGTVYADAEIRSLAIKVFHLVSDLEPGLYQDFRLDSNGAESWLTNELKPNGQQTTT